MEEPQRTGAVPPSSAAREARTIANLLADLARDSSLLVQQEIALAKAELLAKLASVGTGSGLIGAGALVAFGGFLTLLAAAVIALALVVAPWLAAVIVGVAALVVGGILALIGRNRLSAANLTPQRSLRSLRDDAAWAKEQMR